MPEFEMMSGVNLPEHSDGVLEAANQNDSELGPAQYPTEEASQEIPTPEQEEVPGGTLTFDPEAPGDYGFPPQRNEGR